MVGVELGKHMLLGISNRELNIEIGYKGIRKTGRAKGRKGGIEWQKQKNGVMLPATSTELEPTDCTCSCP